MELHQAAQDLVGWATFNRLLGETAERPSADAYNPQELFAGIGVMNATSILRDRGVNYICASEAENAIYVYCRKAPRVKDRKAFENTKKGNPSIILVHGDICIAGTPPNIPRGVAPYHRHNNLYTCGSSIHLSTRSGAGTLGALVRDSGGTLYGLSNNHVIGDSNYADPGLPIFAPGSVDIAPGQPDPIVIGHLRAVAPLVDGRPNVVNVSQNLDAGLLAIADSAAVSSMQRGYYDTPGSVVPIVAGARVEKVGRTTGLTRGVVRGVAVNPAPVIYVMGGDCKKVVFFQNVFTVEGDNNAAFSEQGDSGSLVTALDANGQRHAVGIVFAGDGRNSFVIPLTQVLGYFNVELVSGHNV